jgi:hypothetical protein
MFITDLTSRMLPYFVVFSICLFTAQLGLAQSDPTDMVDVSSIAVDGSADDAAAVLGSVGAEVVAADGGAPSDADLDNLMLERKVATSTWQSIIFSSITVNNYDSWLQSYLTLPAPAYLSYMKARNVNTALYLQHYSPPVDAASLPKAALSGVADPNTFYEISFVSDRGEQFHKFLAHAQREGNHLHSADLRGEVALSSAVDALYNMSYFAGWELAHLRDRDAGSAAYTYRPDDVLSISKHRSTSFVKYCQYLSEHVVEKWTRRGLVQLMAGTMSDKLGSSILLIAVFAEGSAASAGTATAAEFSVWYKDLVNNQLSRLYKANSRSFALAPCVSHAYRVMASTDGVVVNNKQSRECTYRGENCVDSLWTKALA